MSASVEKQLPAKERLGEHELSDPSGAIKHIKIGNWDFYKNIGTEPKREWIPLTENFENLYKLKQNAPYFWMMIKDVGSLRSCRILLASYSFLTLLYSGLSASRLWFSGQLLPIVQDAVEKRLLDKESLLKVAAGRLVCEAAEILLLNLTNRIEFLLRDRINAHYIIHIFDASIRLDLPTFEDPMTEQLLKEVQGQRIWPVAWEAINLLSSIISSVLTFVLQISVLCNALRGQQDVLLVSCLLFLVPFMHILTDDRDLLRGVWAATCRNKAYLKLQGLLCLSNDSVYRKEIVAGNLSTFLSSEFKKAVNDAGEEAGDFHSVQSTIRLSKLPFVELLTHSIEELPLVLFALRSVQQPASIPLSLASLNLMSSSITRFAGQLRFIFKETGRLSKKIDALRKLYDFKNMKNKITSGTRRLFEDAQKIRDGVSIEFRNVSFKYPGTEHFALRGASFIIQQGQLCVIVGTNGSGKSTILKLMLRLYDPLEGNILINGIDIKDLDLNDLRNAASMLFQDFTLFPITIGENIGMGDPNSAEDTDKIRQAAELGGALEFIQKRPDQFEDFIERPVRDYYSSMPEATKALFRRSAGISFDPSSGLSGGQAQRLALSRTYMKSLENNDKIGLLLLDEPSAALDPAAEHDVFERLRAMRGSKTMVLSTHRYGHLTRNADVIVCMRGSEVQEVGNHETLMAKEGGYAEFYSLQKGAFM